MQQNLQQNSWIDVKEYYSGFCLFIVIPPPPLISTGGYIGIILSVHLSVYLSSSVHVSAFVWTISPALLNHFLTKLGMVVYYMRRSVMQKK